MYINITLNKSFTEVVGFILNIADAILNGARGQTTLLEVLHYDLFTSKYIQIYK